MKITLSTSGGTTNLTGTVTVTASPQPTGAVTSARFFVDDVLKSTDTSSPFTYSWDTTQVSNGTHQLKAEVFYPRNKHAVGKLTVTVANVTTPPPPPPPPAPVQDLPANVTLPVISGTATEGQTLTVSDGAWTNSPTSYTKQWARCDAAGANCASARSATAATYVLTSEDAGSTIRCWTTAYNDFGASASVLTDPTAAVSGVTPAPAPIEGFPVLMEIEE